MAIGDFLNPINVLQGWGERLMSPLGLVFLAVAIIYILLRVTGKIEGLGVIFNRPSRNSPGRGGNGPYYKL